MRCRRRRLQWRRGRRRGHGTKRGIGGGGAARGGDVGGGRAARGGGTSGGRAAGGEGADGSGAAFSPLPVMAARGWRQGEK